MRVLCCVATLDVGGAERVMCNLANVLSTMGVNTTLATGNASGALKGDLSPSVRLVDFGSSRALTAFPKMLREVWRWRPDVILTVGTHVNALVGAARCLFPRNVRVVARETSLLDAVFSSEKCDSSFPARKQFLLKLLVRFGYPQLDNIICESNGAKGGIVMYGRVAPSQISTIYNPVSFDTIRHRIDCSEDPFHRRSEEFPNARRVVVVGRLAKVKAFNRVIAAFPKLLEKAPGSNLVIVGDGAERGPLTTHVRDMKLDDHVQFVGFDSNPWRWMAHADLFVLSSEYENMPNVLVESIACGCPFVSLRIPGGVEELLTQVSLQDRIVAQLEEWNDEWFKPLPAKSVETTRQLFDAPNVVRQYLALMGITIPDNLEIQKEDGR